MAEGSGFAGYGYTDSGGEKIAALIDMINGGGAGRAGQEFEGGGILSLIANLLASPYGSQARGAASPATAPRPTARPAGGAPAPAQAPVNAPPSPALPSDPALMASEMLPPSFAGRPEMGATPSAPATRTSPAMSASVEGPMLPEMLDAAQPPADSVLMGSFPFPDYPVRNETQAESLIRNTPRVPSDSRPATPMGLRDRFVTRFDPGRPPGARPRARPQEFTFEYFVESLGPAAEGVSPEILRTAYRNFLQGYEAN